MKANLTIADRFAILGILPVEGNFATLKIVRQLREKLSLSEVEIQEYNVKQTGDQITWKDGMKMTELEFGDFETELMRSALTKLDEAAKLGDNHFRIYEQFMEVK